MLNNFCFHVYAQKSLFMAENCNVFFLTATTSSCEFGVSRAGSQLKMCPHAGSDRRPGRAGGLHNEAAERAELFTPALPGPLSQEKSSLSPTLARHKRTQHRRYISPPPKQNIVLQNMFLKKGF